MCYMSTSSIWWPEKKPLSYTPISMPINWSKHLTAIAFLWRWKDIYIDNMERSWKKWDEGRKKVVSYVKKIA